MIPLAKYEQVRALLAELTKVDDIKDIRDKAIAMQEYAIRAKDRVLAANAAEYRARSERRLGELMATAPKAKASGSNQHGAKERGHDDPAPLSLRGIDKNLAKAARIAWAMDNAEFEAHIEKIRNVAQALADSLRDAIKMAREMEHKKKIATRRQKHLKIAGEARLTAHMGWKAGQFGLIYADPPWAFKTYSEKGDDRGPQSHYPVLEDQDIAEIKIDGYSVSELSAGDSVCFLWCTSANLSRGLATLCSWGFEYKTHLIWDKVIAGTGYIFRNCHELLLYGSKGKAPQPLVVPESIFVAKKTEHSVKPAGVRELLERMYPDFDQYSRIELFARGEIPGWSVWGLEASNQLPEAKMGSWDDLRPGNEIAIPDDLSIPEFLKR